jgi:hypothetical protein
MLFIKVLGALCYLANAYKLHVLCLTCVVHVNGGAKPRFSPKRNFRMLPHVPQRFFYPLPLLVETESEPLEQRRASSGEPLLRRFMTERDLPIG